MKPVVALSASLVLLLAAEVVPPADAQGARPRQNSRVPYIQSFGNGTAVDWLKGEASVIGRVRIFRNLKGNPVTYEVTQKEAEEEGYTRLIAALGETAMDANTRLSSQPEVLKRYRKLIEKTPAAAVLQDQGPMFRVRVVAPLRGEASLMTVLLPDRKPDEKVPAVTTVAWRLPREKTATGVARARRAPEPTGLVIDARQLPPADVPAPAFLTRVVDVEGRVVYGVDAVDLDFARTYGMAVYAAPSPAGAPLPPPGREGADPIEVMAVGSRGELKGDIVIETAEADRILKAAAEGTFLKECRVMVLMPPSPRPPAIEPPGKPRQAPAPAPAPR